VIQSLEELIVPGRVLRLFCSLPDYRGDAKPDHRDREGVDDAGGRHREDHSQELLDFVTARVYSEYRLVEQPAIALFAELGWQTVIRSRARAFMHAWARGQSKMRRAALRWRD